MSKEKCILHLEGIAHIEEGKKLQTVFFGQRWQLVMDGQPARLRDNDDVVVKIYLKEQNSE